MACGCRGSTPSIATGAESAPQPLAANSSIEYVVRFADGSYSESQPSMEAAFQLAAVEGGQARARATKAAATI